MMEVKSPLPTLSEESLDSLYATAYELYRNGRHEDAKRFFRFLTIADTFDRRFWMGLAACYHMLKDYSAAIECYSVAAVQNPDDPFVHRYAADCFFLKGDVVQALKTLDSAITAAKKTHQDLVPKLEFLADTWSKREGVVR